MSTPGWIPCDQDFLQARSRTTGIAETTFKLGASNLRMVDVGGQRSERKKWIHCFEDVSCMIFVAAISGYDQCTAEDPNAVSLIDPSYRDSEVLTPSQNQMHEALILFDLLVNGEPFKHTPIILFLNKIDVFRKKLAISPLSQYYADFTGCNTDLYAAARYFADRFQRINKTRNREIYIYYTNATNSKLLDVTMASVQEVIIRKKLRSFGLKSHWLEIWGFHDIQGKKVALATPSRNLVTMRNIRVVGTPGVLRTIHIDVTWNAKGCKLDRTPKRVIQRWHTAPAQPPHMKPLELAEEPCKGPSRGDVPLPMDPHGMQTWPDTPSQSGANPAE